MKARCWKRGTRSWIVTVPDEFRRVSSWRGYQVRAFASFDAAMSYLRGRGW